MHVLQAASGASLSTDAVRARRTPLVLLVGLLGLALDQVAKQLAVEHLANRPPVHLVGSLLQLTFVRNPGAAFSTGTSHTWVFTIVAVVAALVVLWFSLKVRSTGWAWALGLLLAGVLGNLGDRLFREPGHFRGHVVDFIALPHWPVFNVADICINIAAALFIIEILRGVRLDGSRKTDEGNATEGNGADL